MTETERRQIIALVKSEVIPAIGCTEPIAVALCVAKAAEVLNKRPEKITVLLSANILKNAMGVGIPGTGMIGLPIAVALGALIGKSVYQLEVLKESTPDAVEAGKRFIEEKRWWTYLLYLYNAQRGYPAGQTNRFLLRRGGGCIGLDFTQSV